MTMSKIIQTILVLPAQVISRKGAIVNIDILFLGLGEIVPALRRLRAMPFPLARRGLQVH